LRWREFAIVLSVPFDTLSVPSEMRSRQFVYCRIQGWAAPSACADKYGKQTWRV